MGRNLFSLLIAFFLIMSCTGGSKTTKYEDPKDEEDNQYPIYVSLEDILKKEGTEPLSSVASEIVYIPLETKDYSLLKEVKNIVILKQN